MTRITSLAQEVRAEIARITWPTRREILTSTGIVFAMAMAVAVFFFVVDRIIVLFARLAFGLGV